MEAMGQRVARILALQFFTADIEQVGQAALEEFQRPNGRVNLSLVPVGLGNGEALVFLLRWQLVDNMCQATGLIAKKMRQVLACLGHF